MQSNARFFAFKEQKQRSRVTNEDIRMNSDWLRAALLLSEISHSMARSALYGNQKADLATGRERKMTTGGRA